jgi:alpha-L-fucosidase
LEEWGATIKKTFSNPIASTAGKGDRILLSLENSTIIENIVLQEDITMGQRVRAYSIQAYSNGEWKTIAKGQSIGHKRIHKIDPTEVEQLRLEITEKILPPVMELISIY